ncbi:hypothetical protein BDZ85DRAFT_285401 [Elsinoe ampelina]|uniref:F-box domain-containing protein n=1 Tax=Elsinoe ampelina TaxID=302913 RepID=A0A6A6G1T4_9PEZI|nr:hypothetical protein BDZ85DRAFT_285401 [Elsinoe ampelina]
MPTARGDRQRAATTLAQTIFSSPYLTEIILSHLDAHSISGVAHQVCREWKIMIETSPSIRRKLYLQPDKSETVTRSAPRWHSQANHEEKCTFCKGEYARLPAASRPFDRQIDAHVLNPLLSLTAFTATVHCLGDLALGPLSLCWSIKQIFNRPEDAAWTQMFLTMPPIKKAVLGVTIAKGKFRSISTVYHLEVNGGIKIIDLLSMLAIRAREELWKSRLVYVSLDLKNNLVIDGTDTEYEVVTKVVIKLANKFTKFYPGNVVEDPKGVRMKAICQV